jgi:hypothetical protein
MLYVEDVDTFTKKAVAAGAKLLRPVKNQFYGDRSGTFLDPFGYKWTIGTHLEGVPPEEMETRMTRSRARVFALVVAAVSRRQEASTSGWIINRYSSIRL